MLIADCLIHDTIFCGRQIHILRSFKIFKSKIASTMSSSYDSNSESSSRGPSAGQRGPSEPELRPSSAKSLETSLTPDEQGKSLSGLNKEEGLFSPGGGGLSEGGRISSAGSSGSSASYHRKSTTKEKMKQAFTGILLTSSMSVLARKSKSALTKVSNAEYSSSVLTHRLYSYGQDGTGGKGAPRKLKPIGDADQSSPSPRRVYTCFVLILNSQNMC
jgi:hypothetical protein